MGDAKATGRGLVDHWAWAAKKGLMKGNSARALGSACNKILGVLEAWEGLDVTSLDVDDAFRRFQNLCSKDYTPDSLEAYRRRFKQAVGSYLEYVRDPSAWKAPAGGDRTQKPSLPTRGSKKKEVESEDAEETLVAETGLIRNTFQLAGGRRAILALPTDLSKADVTRLTSLLNLLVVDDLEAT